jgi:hypothetical protein
MRRETERHDEKKRYIERERTIRQVAVYAIIYTVEEREIDR